MITIDIKGLNPPFLQKNVGSVQHRYKYIQTTL